MADEQPEMTGEASLGQDTHPATCGSSAVDELIRKFHEDPESAAEIERQAEESIRKFQQSKASEISRQMKELSSSGLDLCLSEPIKQAMEFPHLQQSIGALLATQRGITDFMGPIRAAQEALIPWQSIQEAMGPTQTAMNALEQITRLSPSLPGFDGFEMFTNPLDEHRKDLEEAILETQSANMEKEMAQRRSWEAIEELRDKTSELVESQGLQIHHLESVNQTLKDANIRAETDLAASKRENGSLRRFTIGFGLFSSVVAVAALWVAYQAWQHPQVAPDTTVKSVKATQPAPPTPTTKPPKP